MLAVRFLFFVGSELKGMSVPLKLVPFLSSRTRSSAKKPSTPI